MLDKIDLNAIGVAQSISSRIKSEIDEWCLKEYDDGHRSHLGASLIGDECSRKLWYVFRWAVKEKFEARMLRLFQRGHREEDQFVRMLEGIGFRVYFENYEGLCYIAESDEYLLESDIEVNSIKDNLAIRIKQNDLDFKKHVARAKADGIEFPQFRTSGAEGHFGGSLDGIAYFPPSYGIDQPILLEFKTNGTGATFNKLVSVGMAEGKPQHYAQTCVYGSDPQYNFSHVLYLNVNKNDDDLHIELVKLNHEAGRHMRLKAERIVFAEEAPPKISQDPTRFNCKFCAAIDICHNGKQTEERNCRSCQNAVPIANKQWGCKHYNMIIPKENIPMGCKDFYKAIV